MIFPPAQLPLPAMPGLVCVCVGIMSLARLGQLPELVLPDLYETLLLCLGLQEAFWAEVFFLPERPGFCVAPTLLKHTTLGKEQLDCFPISTRNYTSSLYHVNYTRQYSSQEINGW